MSTYLTSELLRDFAGDAAHDSNSKLTGELTFSDEELMEALKAGARAYNSVPPFGLSSVQSNQMHTNSNLFFNACCAALFRRRVRFLSQQAVQVQAGNMSTDPDGQIRKELSALADQMHSQFEQEARSYKGQLNMAAAYGAHG